ncbi:MAG: DegT/DnrJ/EryC1/StrS family aminotransferase [Candidatus Omnitrophica bacterium]|nr:DegT/DnrJ/EryC1/StrS family aminotransferase [Candidatus Omnitrophota bacterium]
MKYIPLSKPSVGNAELKAVSDVLKSGWWTTGPKVKEFESSFSDYLGNNTQCVALNSCTSGLFLALKALGIGKGDEVIVPTWTFVATAHVVLWTGAKVVLCDVDPLTLNIDPEKVEKLITKKTKAIIPVHFAGLACDMDALLKIGKRYSVAIIEDAAHAAGARYHGKKIGSFGDIAVFSFYVTKNLACGEGGMLTARNSRLIEQIRRLSYFGINKEAFKRYAKSGSWFYDVEGLGFKCNMDDIHASLGITQLKKLDSFNARRRLLVERYKKQLHPMLRFQKTCAGHSFHLFVVSLPALNISYADVMRYLRSKGVGANLHFVPLHEFSFYKKMVPNHNLHCADSLYERVLSLPLYPLMTDRDVASVSKVVNDLVKKHLKSK